MSDYYNLLILLLKTIELDEDIKIYNNYYTNKHPLVKSVTYIANKYLIDDEGYPNRENMEKLKQGGFPIFPGETDRFGWLTGCIQLKNGIIVFG